VAAAAGVDADPLTAVRGDGVHRIVLADGRSAVLKRRGDAPEGFFAAEADGLAALRVRGGLRVPTVLGCARDHLLLEDLGRGRPGATYWQRAASGLAALHARAGAAFGFDRDGFCGPTPQPNRRMSDGHAFFVECRLRPQLQRALEGGRLASREAAMGERIAARLYSLLPAAPPVRVHGDLWLGNLHCCADGAPALVDGGAVHDGWAEADLAMLTLFGEPPAEFFDAYRERAGLARGWRERAPLLNLYHLLNHLNLFGAGYHGQVVSVLRRFGA
jgi:fructosamine-3-kinase